MASKPFPRRSLGKDGPDIPAMGLGLMVLGGAYGKRPSDEEQFKLLDRAVELGETFWDTAECDLKTSFEDSKTLTVRSIYGNNLEMLAKWFRRTGKRNEVFVASKFGLIMDANVQLKGIDSSAKYCKEACYKSLERLGVDYIDLYYVHHINPDTPIEETMRAMVELQEEGKIKHIGLCACSSNTLRRAYKVAPVAAVQFEYSAFVRDIEGERGSNMLQTCRELGIAVVCFGPIGRGLLTGMVTSSEAVAGSSDIRTQWVPRFKDENMKKNMKVVNELKTIADRKGCTLSQLALAWVLKQGEDIIPIPGTKRIKYLEENWDALDVKLSDAEEAEIRHIVETADIGGFETNPHAFIDTKEEV